MKRHSLFLLLGAAVLLVALVVPVLADSQTTLTVTVPLSGDVNGDGTRVASDLITLMKYLTGAIPAPKYPDVNRDGVHDLLDLVRLMKLLAN